MCGRFDLDSREAEVQKLLRELPPDSPPVKIGEVYPTNLALTLIARDDLTTSAPMRWGFPRWDGKGVVFNARAETSMAKPFFKHALTKNPAIIPTTGFYEWTKDGPSRHKYKFTCKDEPVLYLAGFWNHFADQSWPECFTILTTAANAGMAPYHNRMPVLLAKAEAAQWLKGENRNEILHRVPFNLNIEKIS